MKKQNSIGNLRKNYSFLALDKNNILSDPFRQFEAWFNDTQNSENIEPNAFVLATVDSNQKTSLFSSNFGRDDPVGSTTEFNSGLNTIKWLIERLSP